MKRHGDRLMSTKKGNLLQRLVEWEIRGPLSVKEEVGIAVDTARIDLKKAEYEVELEDDDEEKEVYFEQL